MTERGGGNDKGGMVSYASRVCPVSLLSLDRSPTGLYRSGAMTGALILIAF